MRRIAVLVALMSATAAHGAEPYLFELLKQEPYRTSWEVLFSAETNIPDWVVVFSDKYDGVATPSRIVRLNGADYRFASVCKPHDCAGNELNVLFGPGGSPAWALLTENGARRWLGNPDDRIRGAITEPSNGDENSDDEL